MSINIGPPSVEELRPRRDPSHNPIFQVMFVHHGNVTAAEPVLGLPRLRTEAFGGTRALCRKYRCRNPLRFDTPCGGDAKRGRLINGAPISL